VTGSALERRQAYLAWGLVCIIWGTTYLGIRVSLETMPPALMGGLRWTIAGGLLVLYLLARGQPLPSRDRWRGIALMAFLLLGLGNGGVVFAEQWVPSGLAAVLVASSPFWMSAVEASLHDGDRMSAGTAIGLTVGFSGILVLVWPELSLGSSGSAHFLMGVIALQIAAIGWSLGSAYSRRHARQDDVLGTTALQMLAGGLMMTAAGTLRGEWADLSFTVRSGSALLYLSTIGAIGGFVAYTYALRHLEVSFVSLYAYINPIIAVALGVVLLGEPFNGRIATAAALVFLGVAIVRSRPIGRPRPAAQPVEASAALPQQMPSPKVDSSRRRRIA
jgi:drug/metabolite transporter (DMT)-like permease